MGTLLLLFLIFLNFCQCYFSCLYFCYPSLFYSSTSSASPVPTLLLILLFLFFDYFSCFYSPTTASSLAPAFTAVPAPALVPTPLKIAGCPSSQSLREGDVQVRDSQHRGQYCIWGENAWQHPGSEWQNQDLKMLSVFMEIS